MRMSRETKVASEDTQMVMRERLRNLRIMSPREGFRTGIEGRFSLLEDNGQDSKNQMIEGP